MGERGRAKEARSDRVAALPAQQSEKLGNVLQHFQRAGQSSFRFCRILKIFSKCSVSLQIF